MAPLSKRLAQILGSPALLMIQGRREIRQPHFAEEISVDPGANRTGFIESAGEPDIGPDISDAKHLHRSVLCGRTRIAAALSASLGRHRLASSFSRSCVDQERTESAATRGKTFATPPML